MITLTASLLKIFNFAKLGDRLINPDGYLRVFDFYLLTQALNSVTRYNASSLNFDWFSSRWSTERLTFIANPLFGAMLLPPHYLKPPIKTGAGRAGAENQRPAL
ncbi:hypothetical protein HC231_02535 [Brenneria izadpanahii]|uniref:Uncharacterized protein n=1 Tax=Brenneria izadpanahii TaxID=2722756 RepID=A0ABX7URV9_9GAMM|nr:hypothetical protein [Brenneria izadpanahii]QTF06935.1 hypothetical protein HC231_02535 [Brenneria izadpanahii]